MLNKVQFGGLWKVNVLGNLSPSIAEKGCDTFNTPDPIITTLAHQFAVDKRVGAEREKLSIQMDREVFEVDGTYYVVRNTNEENGNHLDCFEKKMEAAHPRHVPDSLNGEERTAWRNAMKDKLKREFLQGEHPKTVDITFDWDREYSCSPVMKAWKESQ